jgi:hypothetical protein
MIEGNYEQKVSFENIIVKFETIYCDPLYFAVPLQYAIFSRKIFHPKNRVLEREYCISRFIAANCNFRNIAMTAINIFPWYS